MRRMLARILQLAAPSLAMAVVGFALLGPGATRSFDGARLWGGPTEGAPHLSWRVLGVERFRGIDSTKDIGPIVVRARTQNGIEAVAQCRTRRDGTCDIELPLTGPVHGVVHAEVTTEGGLTTLASGDFARDAAGWDRGPPHPSRLPGQSQGDLALELRAPRGVFAAPFRDELVVAVKRGASPIAGAKVTLHTEGADIEGATDSDASATRPTSDRGEATFALVPRTHTIEMTVRATSLGLAGTWDGVLPVIPGAIWLDPQALATHRIRVVSPVPRELVYATLCSRSARLWGGVVPLSPDAHGYATGEIDWPPGVGGLPGVNDDGTRAPLWLTLASDPRGSGLGTVGWPVETDGIVSGSVRAVDRGELPFRDWMLLDGMPAAELRDAARRARARGLSAAALGAAAVIEGVLLARGSYRKGEGDGEDEGDGAGTGRASWVWLIVAIATVALAFAALGIVAMWKTG